ncbi:MAG: hypothetical protein Q4C87_12575 [Actinomycetaceae bacterium]|nr:hypothetical protein [Actinomycetaceae bacterium]
MRILEIASLIVVSSIFLSLAAGRPRLWWQPATQESPHRPALVPLLLAALALIAPIASLIVHNSRTSMWPIYGTSFILAAYLLWRTFHRPQPRKKGVWPFLGRLVIGLIALLPATASALFTAAFPVFSLPDPTGENDLLGVTQMTLTDSSREETFTPDPNDKRTLNVTIYFPADSTLSTQEDSVAHLPEDALSTPILSQFAIPEALRPVLASLFDHSRLIKTHSTEGLLPHSGPLPILFYSPGMGTVSADNIPLFEELASHGFIVVTTDHPYTSGPTLSSEINETTTTEQHNEFVTQRGKDLSFLLDQMAAANEDPSNIFHGHIDIEKVGVLGFSYGAATTVQTLASDPRFKAGFGMDGAMYGDDVDKDIPQPLLYALSTNTLRQLTSLQSGSADMPLTPAQQKEQAANIERAITIMGAPNARRWTVTMQDSVHLSYTFVPLLAPALIPSPHSAQEVPTIRALAVDYFTHTLLGEEAKILGKDGAYPRPLIFSPDPAHPVSK